MTSAQSVRRLAGLSLAALALLLGGCPRNNSQAPAGQVAATVNGSEISVHQVQAALQRDPRLAQLGDAAGPAVLKSLVEQELAAQAARAEGLDNDPAVLQAMELAKREVLARAYQDRLADKAELPGTQEADRYYDEHPLLFARRAQYTLQELLVEGRPEDLQALAERIAQTTSAEETLQAVQATGLRFGARQAIRYAEELPPATLERLDGMTPGSSVLVPGEGGGAAVLTLMRVDPAAVERGVARQAIVGQLTLERKRQRVAKGMDTLRQTARIEYGERFAPRAAASSPQPAAAPQPPAPASQASSPAAP